MPSFVISQKGPRIIKQSKTSQKGISGLKVCKSVEAKPVLSLNTHIHTPACCQWNPLHQSHTHTHPPSTHLSQVLAVETNPTINTPQGGFLSRWGKAEGTPVKMWVCVSTTMLLVQGSPTTIFLKSARWIGPDLWRLKNNGWMGGYTWWPFTTWSSRFSSLIVWASSHDSSLFCCS